MTQRDMAGYLNITPVTLRNWRKKKPNLYKIVLQGFAVNEIMNKNKENMNDMVKYIHSLHLK